METQLALDIEFFTLALRNARKNGPGTQEEKKWGDVVLALLEIPGFDHAAIHRGIMTDVDKRLHPDFALHRGKHDNIAAGK